MQFLLSKELRFPENSTESKVHEYFQPSYRQIHTPEHPKSAALKLIKDPNLNLSKL